MDDSSDEEYESSAGGPSPSVNAIARAREAGACGVCALNYTYVCIDTYIVSRAGESSPSVNAIARAIEAGASGAQGVV